MNMVYLLVSEATIVLQNVVVVVALSCGNLLSYWQHLGESIVRDVGQLSTVVLGDDELRTFSKCRTIGEGPLISC